MPRWCRHVFVPEVLTVALCLLPENWIYAQQKGLVVEESGYGSSAHSLVLLKKKLVQDELKLDRDQRAKLEEIAGRRQTLSDQTERHKQNVDLGKTAEQLLSPVQLTRFKEISLQAHGISAMTDSRVTKTLKISNDQLKRLRAIQLKFVERIKASPMVVRTHRYFELQRNVMSEVMALLTPAQRKRYLKMTGEPIDVERLLINEPQRKP